MNESIDLSVKKQGRPMRELTGQRFGQLTAVRPTERRKVYGAVIWEWRCDCGAAVYRAAHELKNSGQRVSCGCRSLRWKTGLED